MKKLISVLIITLMIVFPITGCQKSADNSTKTENQATSKTETSEIFAEKQKINYDDGFNIVKRYTLEQSDEIIKIMLLTNAELDENGKPIMDDSQDWALVSEIGDNQFTLISKKALQLGLIDTEVYSDLTDNTSHILATVKDSGSLNLYDFYYNKDKNCFVSSEIYSKDNIKINSAENN